MTTAAPQAGVPRPAARPAHVLALLAGNAALALGPWSVRLADTGPVAAGFWRLSLALPLLAVLALANRQQLTGFPRRAWLAMAGAGIFFGLDLAAWHIGIGMTRLGNVTLFGNSGSLILMAWGLIALRRLPRSNETLAFAAAIGGSAILLGRSLQVGTDTLHGDLFCLLAGFFYTFYILLLQGARAKLGSWSLLFWSSAAGTPVLLVIAVALGEQIMPVNWWPLIALSLGSQVMGQGLLVYSLRHFSPLIIGLALLTQPVIAVLAGWFAFGETFGWIDAMGMVMVAGALVLAQARGQNRDEAGGRA